MKFDYRAIFNKVIRITSRYKYLILGGAVIITLLVSVFRINQHSNVDLNQERYDEQYLTIKRINFDLDTIERILELKDLNVDIESIFPDSRTNPFN
ncbi:MAG: hypothetical protein R3313_01385 [Candidatus Saccharimonadales bacterium]|nr:hypothetical protein [Candidatus Saccharimonadales bacterium]